MFVATYQAGLQHLFELLGSSSGSNARLLQLEVPDVEVFLDSARSDRLSAQGASHLEMPSDDDVGSALAMFGSNLGNLRMLQNLMASLRNPEVMEPWRAQGRSAEPRAE